MNNSIIDQIFRTGVVLLFIILAISCEKVKNLNNDYTGQVDTISDIEGNTYKTIGIGSQIWMAENLRVTRLNDGTIIPEEINDSIWVKLISPAVCWYYNDSISYQQIYGPLYNFYVVNTGLLCPIGWHVPARSEWETLANFVGGEKIAGGKLKQSDGSHWNEPNPCYLNNYQFMALPAGCRRQYDGEFRDIGDIGYWWTSTPDDYFTAECQAMLHDDTSLSRSIVNKKVGFSIRCIKD